MAVQNKTTIDEFEVFIAQDENKERLFELIDGEIVENVVTEEHGIIAVNVSSALHQFVKAYNLGRVMVEVRHRIPDDVSNERLPDVSFTSAGRAMPLVTEGAVPQMPDLAVEIKSPSDRYIGMRQKAAYYLENGSRMVWLIFPEKRLVEVYKPDADIEILNENDTLNGGEVLPNFTLAVKDIFAV